MARHSMSDTRLELEYFERISVNPRLTLLRVGGSPAPDEEVLALVVSADGEDFRTTPLGGSVAVEESGRWRAAFPVPSDRLAAAELSYTLETGETVELPEPAVRELPARVEEPAVAEEPATAEQTATADEPTPAAPPGRRWWLRAALLLAAALAVMVAVIVIAANTGSSDDGTTAAPAPHGGRSPATLQALPEAPQGLTARVTSVSDGRSTLTVSGLPGGIYEAWLYNQIIDAQPLATFHGPQASVTLRIPADVGRFHDLDVSREGDGNPGHSGQSVLRVPLAALTG